MITKVIPRYDNHDNNNHVNRMFRHEQHNNNQG